MNTDPNCLFCKIATGAIPCKKVAEDSVLLAFHDIHPQAPTHILVIPKVHIASLADCQPEHRELLGHLVSRLGDLAAMVGLHDGFRTIVNSGRIGRQEVLHLHFHILGGPAPISGGLIGGAS